jgi:uncharacterized membrane protein YdjX (TVP38/TMEM64 family)
VKESLLHLLQTYPHLAIFISLVVSILIAIAGLLPSFFITAANILFFGFWQGTFISFLGEALGAAISFVLYRKGFGSKARHKLEGFPRIQPLINASGTKAATLIFSLRLLPFVPSGLITFAGAIGRISFPLFFISSTLGKLPALLLEAYSVYHIIEWNLQGKLILTLAASVFIYLILKKKSKPG